MNKQQYLPFLHDYSSFLFLEMSASSDCYACVKKTTMCPAHDEDRDQANFTRDQESKLLKLLDLIPNHLLSQAQKILDGDDDEESDEHDEESEARMALNKPLSDMTYEEMSAAITFFRDLEMERDSGESSDDRDSGESSDNKKNDEDGE